MIKQKTEEKTKMINDIFSIINDVRKYVEGLPSCVQEGISCEAVRPKFDRITPRRSEEQLRTIAKDANINVVTTRFQGMSISEVLAQLETDESGERRIAADVYKDAGITRQVYSKILSNNVETIKRDTALGIVLALGLNAEVTKEFFTYLGYSFPSNKKEGVVLYYIEGGYGKLYEKAYGQHMALDEVNNILEMLGEPVIHYKATDSKTQK